MSEDSEDECGASDDNRLESCFDLHGSKSKAKGRKSESHSSEQWRLENAFNRFWKGVEKVIDSTLDDENADCFKSIEQWICNSQLCKTQINLYRSRNCNSTRLSSAVLFSGSVDSSDSHSTFNSLCSYLKKGGKCRVARLQPHLLLGKNGVNSPLRSLFRQFVGITPETTDMAILAAWHQEPSNKNVPLVVIVEDAEHSNNTVLAELVVILSEWAGELPLFLILGMATTGDSLQVLLPAAVIGRLQIHSFFLKSPLDRLEAVMQAVLIDLPFVFTWGISVVKFFYEFFYTHDNTVTSFIRLLKISCMEHFCKQPLSSLCLDLVDSASQEEFEKLCKKLPAPLVEYASSLASQGSLTGSAKLSKKLAEELWNYRASRGCWSMTFQCFLAAGLHMDFNFADVYHGALSSSNPSSIVTNENVMSQIIEKMKHLPVSAISNICKQWKLVTSHDGQCSKDLECLQKQVESTLLTDVMPTPQSPPGKLAGSPPSITTRRMRSLMGCNSQSHCNGSPKPTSEKTKSSEKAKAKLMRMAMEFLERLQRDYLVAPESRPFHEVFCFNDVEALKQATTGETRKLVHEDLVSSCVAIKCDCCPSDGSLSSSLHDTALAYSLSLEHNELINVHDWYQSFETLHAENKPPEETIKKRGSKRKIFPAEGEIPKTRAASIQARFCKAVAELHVTGLLRLPKKRRPDSVQRISIGFS